MNKLTKDTLVKLMSNGHFPNNKNRIWTMCQVTLKLVTQCIEEAEADNLTDEQFFINFEDCLNNLSCKDHNNPSNGLEEFKENLSNFYKDQN